MLKKTALFLHDGIPYTECQLTMTQNAGAGHNDKRLYIRHWQAFKANIEKRKQIQTQIAVIHNV